MKEQLVDLFLRLLQVPVEGGEINPIQTEVCDALVAALQVLFPSPHKRAQLLVHLLSDGMLFSFLNIL
jgi:hypothetical protein